MSLLKPLPQFADYVFYGSIAALYIGLGGKLPGIPPENCTTPHPTITAQTSTGFASSNYDDGNLANQNLPAIPPDNYHRLDWSNYPHGGSLDERIEWALKKN